MSGFDRPLEELEAGREAQDELTRPGKPEVNAAIKRAEYCLYQRTLGYTFVDNPDMRHLAVLLLEKRRLEFALQTIGDLSMSFKPICDRVLMGGFPADGRSEP